MAQLYGQKGADELVFLDITASSDKRNIMVDVVERTGDVVFIPFTVGGGLRNIEDIKAILRAGADKVSLNTSAVQNPDLLKESSRMFGSQCIVLAIDAKKKGKSWEVYTHGGRTATGIDAIEWAKRAENLGCGEILLTSMDADGTKDGYDIPLTKAISEAVTIPVIASGGAGNAEHIYEALTKGKADAALAASIFHYEEHSIRKVKEYLRSKNVSVRL
jgi:cyclase